MKTSRDSSRKIPYPAIKAGQMFTAQMNSVLRDRIGVLIADMIAPENRQSFHHGEGWATQRESFPDHAGKFQVQQVDQAIKFESVMSNDLSVLPNFIEAFAQQFASHIKKLAYQRAGEAAESVGNSVSAQESGSNAAAFLEMLRKLEFGVDRHGNVSLPAIHIHPDNAEKFFAELQSQGQEFEQEVERIKQEKIVAALVRERERLSKYRVKEEGASGDVK